MLIIPTTVGPDVSGRLLSAQEEERRRIARELHDHVSQQLALLAIKIQQLAAAPPDSRAALARSLHDAWQQANDIASDVHAIAYRLHPTKLEALGLVATIRAYCVEMAHQGLSVRFTDGTTANHMSPDATLSLFRVVEEALSNVANHSGASAAEVSLVELEGELSLRIVDAGCGFVPDEQGSAGLGLVSMRERMESLGGSLSIESTVGKGTTIVARLPCRNCIAATSADL